MRVISAFILVLALLTASPSLASAAPDQPAASSRPQRIVAGSSPTIAPRADTAHAWAFLGSDDAGGAPEGGYLLHIVPRQSVLRASAGSVRLAIPLTRAPLAIAGWEGTAILLQGPAGDEAVGPAERSIAALTAEGPIAPGTWDYQPADHLKLRASLPADTVPRSIAGANIHGGGPVMTWERLDRSGTGGKLQIVVLDEGGVWRIVTPPAGFAAGADSDALALASPAGIVIAARAAGEPALMLWRATVDPAAFVTQRQAKPLPLSPTWTPIGRAALPESVRARPLRTIGSAAPCWLWRDGGQTLLAHRAGDSVTLWRLDPDRAVELWHSQPEATVGALVIPGLDAVTLLAYDAPPTSAARAQAIPEAGRLRTVEVSSLTGMVLADTAAHTDGFLSRRELQILWLLFILIGAVILTVVLRTDGPQEVLLPEGTALATPLRRVIGGAIDIAAALALTSVIVGGGPSQWLAPTTSTSSSLVPLLTFFGAGCLLCTIGEATLGASPGKLLLGERVLGLVPASAGAGKEQPTIYTAGRPRFLQAFLRNAVRWFMPPMGMMMLLGNNWRHPGDLLARTVVVVSVDPDTEPPPPSSPDQDQ